MEVAGEEEVAGEFDEFGEVGGVAEVFEVGEEVWAVFGLEEVLDEDPGEGVDFVGFVAGEFGFEVGGFADAEDVGEGGDAVGFAELDEGVEVCEGEGAGGIGFEVDGEAFDEPAVFGVEPGVDAVGVAEVVGAFVAEGGDGFLFAAAPDLLLEAEAGVAEGSAFFGAAGVGEEAVHFGFDFGAHFAGEGGVVLVEDDHAVFEGGVEAGGGFEAGGGAGDGAGVVLLVAEEEDLEALAGAAGAGEGAEEVHVLVVEFVEDAGGFDDLEVGGVGEDGVGAVVEELEGGVFHLEADVAPGDGGDGLGVGFEGVDEAAVEFAGHAALASEGVFDGEGFGGLVEDLDEVFLAGEGEEAVGGPAFAEAVLEGAFPFEFGGGEFGFGFVFGGEVEVGGPVHGPGEAAAGGGGEEVVEAGVVLAVPDDELGGAEEDEEHERPAEDAEGASEGSPGGGARAVGALGGVGGHSVSVKLRGAKINERSRLFFCGHAVHSVPCLSPSTFLRLCLNPPRLLRRRRRVRRAGRSRGGGGGGGCSGRCWG